MPDEEEKVINLRPRLRPPGGGSPGLPPLPANAPAPPAPPPATPTGGSQGAVPDRESPWDTPVVAGLPSMPVPGAAPAAGQGDQVNTGPPHVGALGAAAVLACGLAAFEGIRSWVQESGPRRAEAAKHKRELQLTAVKARADAVRLAAQANAERAKAQAAHLKPRHSAHGHGQKGPQKPGVPARHSGPGKAGKGTAEQPAASKRAAAAQQAQSARQAAAHDRAAKKADLRRQAGKAALAAAQRRDAARQEDKKARQAATQKRQTAKDKERAEVADRKARAKEAPKVADKASPKGASKRGRTPQPDGPTPDRGRLKKARKKTAQGKTGPTGKADGRSKPPSPTAKGHTSALKGTPESKARGPKAKERARTAFWRAAGDTLRDRWQGRERTPPYRTNPSRSRPPKGGSGSTAESRRDHQETPGAAWQARTSPWDIPGTEPATHTVTQAGPARSHRTQPARPWAALPRAPHRLAGQHPGTPQQTGDTPMAASPAPSAPASSLPAAHATEVTVHEVLEALTRLTSDGMDAHDETSTLADRARLLVGALEETRADLTGAHHVIGRRTVTALEDLIEAAGQLVYQAEWMARDSLATAELAEAAEIALARDYRPVADATADAGLIAPSSRLHNNH